MQSSDIPAKFNIPFGNGAGSGFIRNIPAASQIGINDGFASLADGFVPLNATPVAAGGIPPFIQDMNGILSQISAWARWAAAGGPVKYDPSFQTAIGGYPKGAKVQSATNPSRTWISFTENNTTNPDAGGAGWVSDETISYQDMTTPGSGSVTVPLWASRAEVQVVGAGGGGAGAAFSRSGGGGGAGG